MDFIIHYENLNKNIFILILRYKTLSLYPYEQ